MVTVNEIIRLALYADSFKQSFERWLWLEEEWQQDLLTALEQLENEWKACEKGLMIDCLAAGFAGIVVRNTRCNKDLLLVEAEKVRGGDPRLPLLWIDDVSTVGMRIRAQQLEEEKWRKTRS